MKRSVFDAAIFDMDGVVTRTTDLHAAAWKELFDDYLRERESRGEPAMPPFDIKADYLAYVDGKPRAEGARSFLTSRGITLPYGDASDPPDRETVCGLGNRKDALFERRLRAEGAGSYASTVALIKDLRSSGIHTALVTSSRHGREVLGSAGVMQLFEVILDGADAIVLGLKGKPAPDIFREAAERLGTEPRRSIVLEDATAGVQAGRAGGFGLVVGIDRGDNRRALLTNGADLVVSDLSELSLDVLETGRFWASRCVRGAAHYHIRSVTGPDEYHHTVDDNAYTNWMARFNLQKAIWVAQWLEQHTTERWEALCAALALAPDEIAAWEEVARDLYCPQPGPSGVIEQFEGFFQLREYRLSEAERFRPPQRRLFEAEEVNRSQLIKQADVLMLPFLFPEQFSRAVLAANYQYYKPRTDHGSSLSPPVHAALAARLGLKGEAQRYWRRSLWLDLSNTMGNSALGIHAACMAGTWQALVFGFLGIRFSEAGPVLDPEAAARLPQDWRNVDLKLTFRGQVYPVRMAGQEQTS